MALAQKLGAPLQLLFEGEGHIITVELKNGDSYRGVLTEAEDTMNCQLKEVTLTNREGRVQRLEHVFLRGGTIKFIVLPDILKQAPILKRISQIRESKSKSSNKPTSVKSARSSGKK
jgi:small nuclear ribonucleoprotein D3